MVISKNSKIIISIICILVISLFLYYQQEYSASAIAKKKQEEYTKWQQQLTRNYDGGIGFIKIKNYKEAKNLLACFYNGEYNNQFKDSQVLAIYALARYDQTSPEVKYKDTYGLPIKEMSKIPADYNGQFADEIREYKKYLDKMYTTYSEIDRDAEEKKKTTVYIGDTANKVEEVFGEPKRKNRTVVGNTVSEQWVYGNGKYIYIENGRVTAWQN